MRPLQAEIKAALKVSQTIQPEEELDRSIHLLTDYLTRFSFLKTLVLGISGGQDSTLAGWICQKAIEKMRTTTGDDEYRFIAVKLPYGEQADAQDVEDALNFMHPDQIVTVNIKPATDALVQTLANDGQLISDFNKGNIKARERMVAQYAIAGEHQGVVVGTDHAAEAVTGFYTKFGDGAADIMPLWRLTKRQGRQLLQTLNCPKHLYEKTPTADLEDLKPGYADEEALGVSYEAIDDYLEGYEVSDETAEVIESLYQKSAHKRQLPINLYDNWWQ
ncbi:ammonia-dependent NAD(+) synthetase [Aerococcus suis]|uniref:NH(3)-dependent NAD(+) synthetase n=1 Tax=Aerococcus suis TaxID=371602 RepID=A0A1W1Z681_9LACT|nr:ammonia-dependent NAD(+) synthetase [Aerococcus suis]MCI7240016.1 ammonia-dependent NAD(+) synthetase [Aerococcus suis]MDD7758605.1 ammonia-dependent NAD(+) synthetase [Aerococcus suis]MDY4646725.1 ammonia-dependent NAD(+) synthetase [Aerococcus suis]SMC43950.1 NAD+ synthase [Aerococcus suis]